MDKTSAMYYIFLIPFLSIHPIDLDELYFELDIVPYGTIVWKAFPTRLR